MYLRLKAIGIKTWQIRLICICLCLASLLLFSGCPNLMGSGGMDPYGVPNNKGNPGGMRWP